MAPLGEAAEAAGDPSRVRPRNRHAHRGSTHSETAHGAHHSFPDASRSAGLIGGTEADTDRQRHGIDDIVTAARSRPMETMSSWASSHTQLAVSIIAVCA